MITINLNEFSNFSAKAILNFFEERRITEFEFIIPKSTNPTDDKNALIFEEYCRMSYVGQMLHNIAVEFSYYVPCPASRQPFKFIVKISDLEKLADLLDQLIHVIQEGDLTDITTEFQLAASTFFSDAYDAIVEPVTWGLLTLANTFLAE